MHKIIKNNMKEIKKIVKVYIKKRQYIVYSGNNIYYYETSVGIQKKKIFIYFRATKALY